MKAISISPPYAQLILTGDKTVECRTWSTDHRGDLLICSTAKVIKGTIPGHALCVARLVDVVPFRKKHLKAAFMAPSEFAAGSYAWLLDDVRIIRPVSVKGQLGLWDYNGAVEIMPQPQTEADEARLFTEIWEPLIV